MKKYVVFMCMVCGVMIVTFAGGNREKSGDEQSVHQPMVFKTTGPAGNSPTDYQKVQLSDDDIANAQEANYKIAVVMHASADLTNAVLSGIRETAETVGAEIVLVTDAGFDSNKQKADIEDALVLNPDIIIALILDAVSGAVALQPAVDKRIAIALLSNLPQGFVHKKHYASVVTDDLFGMGNSLAEIMNEQLSGKGRVALMFHDANYYVTNQRDRAVKTVLAREYQKLDIVIERGIANPFDGETIASEILTQFPKLEAIYAPWDTIAEGVLAATQASGRGDVQVFSMDLGATTALDMAKGGNMSGIVAGVPFELGATLAKIGVLSKLGKATPPFVTVPAIKVTQQNLEEAWEEILRSDLPVEVKNALNK